MGDIMSDLVSNLHKVLSDTYALYLKTQNYHWNVTGEHFCTLHSLFQEQYEDLAEAVDEIAERVRMLGEKTPGNFSFFVKNSTVKDGDESLQWKGMVQDLAADQQVISKVLKGCLSIAQEQNDECTVDLLVGRLKVHEKNKWMMDSLLS